MADRRIRKIRSQAVDLALSGADVLFVCEVPDDQLGQGAVYLFGNEESPTAFLCARRCLNELKHHLSKVGVELEFKLSVNEKKAKDGTIII